MTSVVKAGSLSAKRFRMIELRWGFVSFVAFHEADKLGFDPLITGITR